MSVANTYSRRSRRGGRRAPVDVMLLDLTLPDGDGLAALTTMRARAIEPRVTAALTGRAEPEIAARCTAAGCRAVLVKPVPIAELLHADARVDGLTRSSRAIVRDRWTMKSV